MRGLDLTRLGITLPSASGDTSGLGELSPFTSGDLLGQRRNFHGEHAAPERDGIAGELSKETFATTHL